MQYEHGTSGLVCSGDHAELTRPACSEDLQTERYAEYKVGMWYDADRLKGAASSGEPTIRFYQTGVATWNCHVCGLHSPSPSLRYIGVRCAIQNAPEKFRSALQISCQRTPYTAGIPVRKMTFSEISIRIHPNPQHGELAVDVAFNDCNAFHLTNRQRWGLKTGLERISDLIKLSRRLEAVKNTLLDSMQNYNIGETARDRTRLAKMDAHLQFFERSFIDAEDPGFFIKTFVLGTLDTADWKTVLPYGKELWSWAAVRLSDVTAPSGHWLDTLLKSIGRVYIGSQSRHIKKLRDGKKSTQKAVAMVDNV